VPDAAFGVLAERHVDDVDRGLHDLAIEAAEALREVALHGDRVLAGDVELQVGHDRSPSVWIAPCGRRIRAALY